METYIEILETTMDAEDLDGLATIDAAKIMADLLAKGLVYVRLTGTRPEIDRTGDNAGAWVTGSTKWHNLQDFTLQQLVGYVTRLQPNHVAQIELDWTGDDVEVTLDTYEII